jgi:hypothetical protein
VSGPPDGGAGVRAVVSPEAVGVVLAVVVVAGLLLSGALPMLGGAGPSPTPQIPSASSWPSPSTPSLDTTTRGALVAALAVNQRLAGHVPELEAAIDGDDRSGATIATILRTMNQEVSVGVDAVGPITADPLTATLGADLGTFYADVARRGDEPLDVSIQEGAVYRGAAAELIVVLEQLPALDDRIADALEGRAVPTASGPLPTPSRSPSAPPSARPSVDPEPSDPGASGSPAPAGPNLIVNGTFDADLAGWSLEVAPGAAASAAHEPASGPAGTGAARIDVTTGSDARSGIAFVSPTFRLQRGQRYLVTAAIRSTERREVRLRIATSAGLTTTARTFSVGEAWSTLTFDLTELGAGSSSALALDLGRGQGSVWLDDVSVVALGGG